jgi:hypothetical protein
VSQANLCIVPSGSRDERWVARRSARAGLQGDAQQSACDNASSLTQSQYTLSKMLKANTSRINKLADLAQIPYDFDCRG